MSLFPKQVAAVVVCASLAGCTAVSDGAARDDAVSLDGPQPYAATWESLSQYQAAPEWFQDAKFGIYAHWGPYAAVKAPYISDWYSRAMYLPEWGDLYTFHNQTYGGAASFGYKDFIPKFSGAAFDADAWADLFVSAGAKFAGPVAEHADGFAMWDSQLTQWDAAEMGPKRDVVGELETAIRARGLKFVTSFHHQWNWGWYSMRDERVDTTDPDYAGLYGFAAGEDAWGALRPDGKRDPLDVPVLPPQAFVDEWQAKVDEVVETYRPDHLWFDNRMHIIPEAARMAVAANFYNTVRSDGREPVLTYKNEDMKAGSATLDLERARLDDIHPVFWLTDTSVAENSWGYAEPMALYTPGRLLADLSDIVSKNGGMLLSIGPRADGTIPQDQKDILLTIGDWLTRNGEAIYATRHWRVYGEGPTVTPQGHLADLKFEGYSDQDVRYTRSKDGLTIYAIRLVWGEGELVLGEMSPMATGGKLPIASVRLVDGGQSVDWTLDDRGLVLPAVAKPKVDWPIVFRIDLKKG